MHEIMQFMTFKCKADTGFQYWETWHRSGHSATRRVRATYTIILGILPMCVSFFIMAGLGVLLTSDPYILASKLKDIEAPESIRLPISPEQIAAVFRSAKFWFVTVGAFHIVPLWFFWENVIPTGRRWKAIRTLRVTDNPFSDLTVRLSEQKKERWRRLHEFLRQIKKGL